MKKNWIVISGQPVDSVDGGGYEFFGPYTEEEAQAERESVMAGYLKLGHVPGSFIVMAVELLGKSGETDE